MKVSLETMIENLNNDDNDEGRRKSVNEITQYTIQSEIWFSIYEIFHNFCHTI